MYASTILIFDGILGKISIEWELMISTNYIVFPDDIFDSLWCFLNHGILVVPPSVARFRQNSVKLSTHKVLSTSINQSQWYVDPLVPCLSQPDVPTLFYYEPASMSHAVLCHTSWLYHQSICVSAFLALSCLWCSLAWSAWSVSHPSSDTCDQTGSAYVFWSAVLLLIVLLHDASLPH